MIKAENLEVKGPLLRKGKVKNVFSLGLFISFFK